MLLIFSEHENVGTDLFKTIFRIKAIGALILLFDSEPHHGAVEFARNGDGMLHQSRADTVTVILFQRINSLYLQRIRIIGFGLRISPVDLDESDGIIAVKIEVIIRRLTLDF